MYAHRHLETLHELGEGRFVVREILDVPGPFAKLRARDQESGRSVLLKFDPTLRFDLQQRLAREGCLLKELEHPSFAGLVNEFDSSEGVTLAKELVRGEPITNLIQSGRIHEEIVHRLATDLVEALTYLHTKGWIHGAVTPDRCLYGHDGRLRLVGLDAAVRTSKPARRSFNELSCFIPPESLTELSARPQFDVYSAGMLIATLLLGRIPSDDGPHWHALPAEWRPIIRAATATDPERRLPSIAALQVLLQHVG